MSVLTFHQLTRGITCGCVRLTIDVTWLLAMTKAADLPVTIKASTQWTSTNEDFGGAESGRQLKTCTLISADRSRLSFDLRVNVIDGLRQTVF
jgi:hypothetical protein